MNFIFFELYRNMPEDEQSSSGYSVFWWDLGNINNYKNVQNYTYRSQDLSLMKKEYSFYENVEVEDTDHYPQGICLTEDFVLISAYADDVSALGKVFVFDRDSGTYRVTLGLDSKSHMGGIAYDGDNLWICNSSNMTIERIPYTLICLLAMNVSSKVIDIRNMTEDYKVETIPSGITYYGNQLWVATHAKYSPSKMISYLYRKENNCLKKIAAYTIPAKVQGISFSEKGEVYFSTSYGRRNSSYIKKYDSIYDVNIDINGYSEMIELPPCSEGIVYQDHQLYVIFESGGKKFTKGADGNGRCRSPLNQILIIHIK